MQWLREHKFEAHLAAFLLMIIPSGGLYFAAQGGTTGVIWALLGLFVLANLFAIVLK